MSQRNASSDTVKMQVKNDKVIPPEMVSVNNAAIKIM
jgi:hypothetical protein